MAQVDDTWISYEYPSIFFDMRIKEYEDIVNQFSNIEFVV